MNNNISVAPLYEGVLSHSGIKGQKWGVMHGPPYPLARGKGGRLPNIKKIVAARQRKEEQINKKALKAEEKKEALKKNIIEHPNKLYKYKDMFSKEELEDILKAIDFDQKLKDVRRGQLKKTVDTAKDIAVGVSAVKNIAMSAVDLYKAGRDITSILKDHGTFSEVQERKKAAEEAAKKGQEAAKKEQEAAKKESSPSKKDTSGSSSESAAESKKSDSTKYETNSPEKRNSGIDTSFGSIFNNDSLITSIKPTTETAYRRKKFVERGEAFLERLGSATPSTYYTPSQSSQSDRRRNRLDDYYSPSSYRS